MKFRLQNLLPLAKSGRLPQPIVAVLALVVLGCVWMFVELADEVMEKETRAFDEAMLMSMRVESDLSDPVGSAHV